MLDLAAKLAGPGYVASLIAAVEWSGVITLGSVIIGILFGLTGLAVFAYGVKWKTQAEVEKSNSEVYAEGREAYKLRSERLEEDLRDCRAERDEFSAVLADARTTIARLEQLPNLERILELMGDLAVKQDAAAANRAEEVESRIVTALARHDEAARLRQEEILRRLRGAA